jgi:hypothetical protein
LPVSVYITILTPARKANSRCRGSPGTSGNEAWLSGRVAQAPARSLDVISTEETLSPARAGRFVSVFIFRRRRFHPELPGIEAARKVAQQENVLVSTWSRGTGSAPNIERR